MAPVTDFTLVTGAIRGRILAQCACRKGVFVGKNSVMTTTPTAPTSTATRHHTGLALAAGVLTGILALYITLVAVGNITDFGTNQQFVRHVLAMDTTFRDDDLMGRAITGTGLQDAAYVAIIVWESVAALVLIWGTWLWMRGRHDRARRVSTYGLLMLLTLFGAGFIAIGGEWFAMWQSKTWNGLDAATRVFLLSGVALIVNQLPDHRQRDAG
jgi:predicted small integral membrane protein